jgi:hypothetical protein
MDRRSSGVGGGADGRSRARAAALTGDEEAQAEGAGLRTPRSSHRDSRVGETEHRSAGEWRAMRERPSGGGRTMLRRSRERRSGGGRVGFFREASERATEQVGWLLGFDEWAGHRKLIRDRCGELCVYITGWQG